MLRENFATISDNVGEGWAFIGYCDQGVTKWEKERLRQEGIYSREPLDHFFVANNEVIVSVLEGPTKGELPFIYAVQANCGRGVHAHAGMIWPDDFDGYSIGYPRYTLILRDITS